MSTRIQELMGEDSPYDAARKFSLRGVSVSPQAIYKWLAGGNIDEERLSMLCEIYGSEPAFIRYGIRTQEALRNGERAAADLIGSAPPQMVQMTMDFLEYQLHKSTQFIAGEQLANYLNLIDKIKKDMEQKKAAEDGSPRSKQPDN